MGIHQIKILDVATANKIAAGEVIERPSSVVKELIENSLDAGANNITVEITKGGISGIIVTDDGAGIEPSQVALAFKRHATSKINTVDDLFGVRTYGFRGEALPSVAAVSKVSVITKPPAAQYGTRYVIEGGKEIRSEKVAFNKGTLIEVKDLFYNVPPRRKHLKTITREAGHVANVVTSMALANPEIGFKYLHNGRLVFHTTGVRNLENAILRILGSDTLTNLIKIKDDEINYIKIYGFISKPQFNRANKNNQYLYINKRWIHSPSLNKIISDAYSTLLPNNRYPVFILHLDVPFDKIDVNVHPTKKQIKIDNTKIVEEHLLKALLTSLKTKESIYVKSEKIKQDKPNNFHTQTRLTWQDPKPVVMQSPRDLKENFMYKVSTEAAINYDLDSEKKITDELVKESIQTKELFPELHAIYQLDNSYIIAIDGKNKGFYLIDQHAAHERIYYDIIQKAMANQKVQSQLLLKPVVLDLTPAEKEFLIENILELQAMGFTLEVFGENTFLIRGVPGEFKEDDVATLVQEILDISLDAGMVSRDKINKMIACKASVTANTKLSHHEMQELLNKLAKTDLPYTCPHGRPTIIHITENEIIKRFNR